MTVHLLRFIVFVLSSAFISISFTNVLPIISGKTYQELINLLNTTPNPLDQNAICSLRYGGTEECVYIASLMYWGRVLGYAQGFFLIIAFLIEQVKKLVYSCESKSCNYSQEDESSYFSLNLTKYDSCYETCGDCHCCYFSRKKRYTNNTFTVFFWIVSLCAMGIFSAVVSELNSYVNPILNTSINASVYFGFVGYGLIILNFASYACFGKYGSGGNPISLPYYIVNR